MPDNNWTLISGSTSQDYTDTAVFEVNPDTKQIALITGQALVAGEKDSQYISFLMPRYWDGIDISSKAFTIEYALAGTYYGTSEAVNAEMTTEQVRFGWVVPETACAISGTLLFVLKITSEDYVLKTQIAEHPVYKTIRVEDVVPEPTKEAWYREFQTRVDSAISEAETAVETAQATLTQVEAAAQLAQTAAQVAQTAQETVEAASQSAQTSAQVAQVSQEAAEAAAQTASDKATEAQGYAQNAEDVKDDVLAAQAAAETAQAGAESAQTASENARDDALAAINELLTKITAVANRTSALETKTAGFSGTILLTIPKGETNYRKLKSVSTYLVIVSTVASSDSMKGMYIVGVPSDNTIGIKAVSNASSVSLSDQGDLVLGIRNNGTAAIRVTIITLYGDAL